MSYLDGLTAKQRRFCDEYLKDLNATRAYMAAFEPSNEASAASSASTLLRTPKVAKVIGERVRLREYRARISSDMVLQELYKVATAGVGDLLDIYDDDDGIQRMRVRPVEDMGDAAKAVSSIRISKSGAEIRTHDKLRALELLGKHLAMWTDRIEQVGDSVVKIQLPDGLE